MESMKRIRKNFPLITYNVPEAGAMGFSLDVWVIGFGTHFDDVVRQAAGGTDLGSGYSFCDECRDYAFSYRSVKARDAAMERVLTALYLRGVKNRAIRLFCLNLG